MTRSNDIRLAHGGGGRLTQQLIENIFLPIFHNETLDRLNDSAILELPSQKIAFTTDSFVVDPIFFPGGDIGRLAVCGTVNDLAVMGAKPEYLSAAFILEEGFSIADLKKIAISMRNAADEAGVIIATGDTKVVPRGFADKCFINTSGVGVFNQVVPAALSRCVEGDNIIVNSSIGCHGMAVVTAREGYGFTTRIDSDVAPLNGLIEKMLEAAPNIHSMRDATRGGLATVLNEMADQAETGMEIIQNAVPVSEEVQGACEMLGFDPFYLANEGVLAASVPSEQTESCLMAMRTHPMGKKACVIGKVTGEFGKRVVLRTLLGSRRILDLKSGEQLPRIC